MKTHFYLYRVNLDFDKFDFMIESAAASVMSNFLWLHDL